MIVSVFVLLHPEGGLTRRVLHLGEVEFTRRVTSPEGWITAPGGWITAPGGWTHPWGASPRRGGMFLNELQETYLLQILRSWMLGDVVVVMALVTYLKLKLIMMLVLVWMLMLMLMPWTWFDSSFCSFQLASPISLRFSF